MASRSGKIRRALRFFVLFVLGPFLLAPSCRPNRHGANPPTLVPPSTFTPTVITTARIDLAWTAVPLDATGVEIDRSVNGGTFIPLVTLPSTQVAFSDTGLTPSTRYGYRIRSVSGSNMGSWSADVFATTIVVSSVTTTGGPPAPLMSHSAVYDSFHQWMVVFGGLKTASATLYDRIRWP
jgi:hypothetical protein